MKKEDLEKEEEQILEDYEKGDFNSVKELEEEKEKHKEYAKNTLRKSKSINIRVSERDLQRIKALAAEKGLPYQTLISSILHRYSRKKERKM